MKNINQLTIDRSCSLIPAVGMVHEKFLFGPWWERKEDNMMVYAQEKSYECRVAEDFVAQNKDNYIIDVKRSDVAQMEGTWLLPTACREKGNT
jgi:hypothetical protein